MQRRRSAEFMDDPAASPAELDRALWFIRLINRRLGGSAALLRHLDRWSRDWSPGQTITLLDVATGSADLPLAAHRWARRRGFDLHITGTDIHPTTLDLARKHLEQAGDDAARAAITLLPGDALTLEEQFGPGSFDYVHAGLFLHHLDEPQIIAVLRGMHRIARRGILWNDLVRSRLGHTAIRVMTLPCERMVRHDAVVSVEAGFTREEALDLARGAGIQEAKYAWNLLTHRFTLAAPGAGAKQQ